MGGEPSCAWDRLSPHYQREVSIRTDDIHYGPNGPGENELGVLGGTVKHLKVLDLGCGGGQNSIAFARRGARVTAVDTSAIQLKYAEQLSREFAVHIRFVNSDMMAFLRDETSIYDIIFSCFSSEYVKDLGKLLHFAALRLKPIGTIILCDLHPFVSSCTLNADRASALMSSISYFDTQEVTFKWNGISEDIFLTRYHRTFSDFFAAFKTADLVIDELIEPRTLSVTAENRSNFPYLDCHLAQCPDVWARLPYAIIWRLFRRNEDGRISSKRNS